MTLEEAVALVLEEGMMTEPVPDNAMATLLHSGREPDEAHLAPLMEALRIVSQSRRVRPLADSGTYSRQNYFRGKIIEHPGQTPIHAYMVGQVADHFRDALESVFQVREGKPIGIAEDTHADTDVLVIIDRKSEYEERHPGPNDTVLLVEVSDLTIDYDLGENALLYAQASIMDYWVVLANEKAIVRHRKPTPEGYREVTRLAGADTISPLAAPEVVWTVSALLGSKE